MSKVAVILAGCGVYDGAEVNEAVLSLLGFGVRPPTPTWGILLNQAHANYSYWWLIIFPSLAIARSANDPGATPYTSSPGSRGVWPGGSARGYGGGSRPGR